jgi:hypothetical protein
MVQVRLYSYGPTTVLSNETVIPPDVFITIVGAGTFEGVVPDNPEVPPLRRRKAYSVCG